MSKTAFIRKMAKCLTTTCIASNMLTFNADAPEYVRTHIQRGGVDIAGSPFIMTCAAGSTQSWRDVCLHSIGPGGGHRLYLLLCRP